MTVVTTTLIVIVVVHALMAADWGGVASRLPRESSEPMERPHNVLLRIDAGTVDPQPLPPGVAVIPSGMIHGARADSRRQPDLMRLLASKVDSRRAARNHDGAARIHDDAVRIHEDTTRIHDDAVRIHDATHCGSDRNATTDVTIRRSASDHTSKAVMFMQFMHN